MNQLSSVFEANEIHLALYKGYKEEDNRPFYAFIAVDGDEYERLRHATGPVILGEYGQVLFSDFGHDVPEWALNGVMSGFKNRLANEGYVFPDLN